MSSSLTKTDYLSEHYGKYEGRKYITSEKLKRTAERRTKCPKCGSRNLAQDYERAEICCADCGFVITENIINTGPEWRFFDFEQVAKSERVGPPMTYRMHNKGLGTITPQGLIWTKKLPGSNSEEIIFVFALSEIDRMASALGLSNDIREQAGFLYRKVREKSKEKGKSLRGQSTEAIISAILYIICKQCGVPRTLEEIAEVSRVEKKRITRSSLFLSRKFELEVLPSFPVDFIPRFCSKLGLSFFVQSKAIEIILETETEIGDGKPAGIAAGAIYIAIDSSGESCMLNKIAAVARVDYATVRDKRNKMKQLLKKSEIEQALKKKEI